VNWVANVILPVFALTQLAAMGALMVSGIVRFAESMVTQAHGI
jgi:hypothetical protein